DDRHAVELGVDGVHPDLEGERLCEEHESGDGLIANARAGVERDLDPLEAVGGERPDGRDLECRADRHLRNGPEFVEQTNVDRGTEGVSSRGDARGGTDEPIADLDAERGIRVRALGDAYQRSHDETEVSAAIEGGGLRLLDGDRAHRLPGGL